MNMKLRYLLLTGLLIPFILLSCKTTPGAPDSPAGPEAGASGPADEAALTALEDARAKAREARALAEYVNGPVYYPGEWEQAETRYTAAEDRTEAPETMEDAQGRIAEWKGIEKDYNEIYNNSLERFAGEQEAKLAAAREEAVEAGAQDLVPDRFAQADEAADGAKEQMEAGDTEAAVKAYKEAWDRYRILRTIAQAHEKQAKADEEDFFSVDPDNYKEAADAGNRAVDLYDEGSLGQSQESADQSLALFTQVVKNGWIARVEEKASAARENRQAAQEAKADVAVKPDFDAAEKVYNQAHVALRGEDYTAASDLFEESGELFDQARENAEEKRRRAEEALKEAEEKVSESEQKALEADELIGGGE